MTRDAMMEFARNWIEAWNRRDVDAVLSHFAEEAIFISPVAGKYVGSPVIKGKAALSAYWSMALERLNTLEFKLDHAAWDNEARELNVVYEANLNGQRRRACEIMTFDSNGKQIKGEALYGADLE